jgi:hypothetical protein
MFHVKHLQAVVKGWNKNGTTASRMKLPSPFVRL